MSRTKFYKTDEFKELSAQWREKLKDSKFEDLENASGKLKKTAESLLHFNFKGINHSTVTYISSKVEYFSLATQFLHEYVFESKQHKRIWYYHSEGYKNSEISKKTKNWENSLSLRQIKSIVVKLKKSMYAMYIGTAEEAHE